MTRSGPRPGGPARALAAEALRRVDEGAYANLVVPPLLAGSGLAERDRAMVTELVYGTTRMRRACDWLVDRFLLRPVDPAVRTALRLGAYQLAYMGTPAHAAVAETVDLVRGPARGMVNAVLRRVAEAGPPRSWPDVGTRLSYPDWIVELLARDLGPEAAAAALEEMNRPAPVTTRPDGYVQDESSQAVGRSVAAAGGRRVADLCAAPGGKASMVASGGVAELVAAGDVRPGRVGLMAANLSRLGAANAAPFVGDGCRPPLRPGAFDHVVVDAPCTGLGVLRRRPDARWRVTGDDMASLVLLQRRLLGAAADLVSPGGRLTYSVCTLTAAETTAVDAWLADRHPDLEDDPGSRPGAPWSATGRGSLVLPWSGGDGMYVLTLRRGGRG